MSTATLTAEHLTSFDDNGYAIVKGLFSRAECAEIVAEVERAQFELNLGDEADGPLVYRPMMHLVSEPLQAVASDPRWEPIVMPLVGDGYGARLYWEQAVCKPAGAKTELPWHQDNGYTPLIPEQYLTCWLAFDDATVDNGCIWVIPGSHLDGTKDHHNDSGGSPFRVGHDGGPEEGIPVPVEAGDVLLFSSLIMHRSGPNTSESERRAWILQYSGGEACSALNERRLDDRLLVAQSGGWLDEPVREREFDLLGVLANYDQR
jgi:phytanoyl-CoA hydroxylase